MNIRDLFGVVAYKYGLPSQHGLTEAAISMARYSFSWDKAFPSKEMWDERRPDDGYMTERRNILQQNSANNVRTLFDFGGIPSYAADLETRIYSVLNRTYKIEYEPNRDKGMRIHLFQKENGTFESVGYGTVGHTPPKDSYIADWKAFVSWSIQQIEEWGYAPDYYQIWNEASGGGFFWGKIDVSGDNGGIYFDRIHKPAAEAIQESGHLMVYGGWPTAEGFSFDRYMQWLNGHNAWNYVDVLDYHYRDQKSTKDMKKLKTKMSDNCYSKPIWKTEFGNTTDIRKIPNAVPRLAMFGLQNKSDISGAVPFRFFYFADSSSWSRRITEGNNKGLVVNSGDTSVDGKLTDNGVAMKTVCNLLGPDKALAPYHGAVHSGTSFGDEIPVNDVANLDAGENSIEAFTVGTNKIVLALHFSNDVPATNGELHLPDLDFDDVQEATQWSPFNIQMGTEATSDEYGGTIIPINETLIPTPEWDTTRDGLDSSEYYARTMFVEVDLKPLSVYISGPYEISRGDYPVWTANPSGGDSPYEYNWQYRLHEKNDGWSNWLNRGGGQEVTITHPNHIYDRLEWKVTVTDAANHTAQSLFTVTLE